MKKYAISKPDRTITGSIHLAGSKSISNRALIIRALSQQDFSLTHLANAKDTDLMQALLASTDEVRDAGAAGTTYRFMTAYLSLQPGTQILTGTERMKQRPIGVLVEALRELGASIEYLENEGYPPLRIGQLDPQIAKRELSIPASTSSQYISALLLIAPTLPNGLALSLKGKVVSRPYIEMTLSLMQQFGVTHTWVDDVITVEPQQYQGKPFQVEADWSAASYYYSLAALSSEVDLELKGLFKESAQGDSVLSEQYKAFGISTEFTEEGLKLSRSSNEVVSEFQWDFLRCPDLAQTIAVTCAGLGIKGRFDGVETLRIKETDRIDALQEELAKVKVTVTPIEGGGKSSFEVTGKAEIDTLPCFITYEDHRMAMAFAPLAMFGKIEVEEPMVVVKSYPDFWKDLEKLGFVVER